MPLIVDYGNGYIEKTIAPAVALNWDWRSNGGGATFQKVRLGILDGDVRSEQEAGRLTHRIDPANPKVFSVRVVDTHGEPILDDAGNEQHHDVSTMQIMEIHKCAFEALFAEQEG